MKNKYILILLIFGTISFSSCSRYIAPPFSDVMKIAQIKTGMKFQQVVDILGVEPYDIFHVQETGASLICFNYRLRKRIIKSPTLNSDEFERETTNETSQTAGDLYYDKNYKVLHVLFNKDGELSSYITSDGIENSNLIVITGNTIQYADQNNIHLLDPAFNSQVINTQQQKHDVRVKRSLYSRVFGKKYQ